MSLEADVAVLDGRLPDVVGSGLPIKPHHSAVFGQIRTQGMRLTDLARGANITPRSMGQTVDELERLGLGRLASRRGRRL